MKFIVLVVSVLLLAAVCDVGSDRGPVPTVDGQQPPLTQTAPKSDAEPAGEPEAKDNEPSRPEQPQRPDPPPIPSDRLVIYGTDPNWSFLVAVKTLEVDPLLPMEEKRDFLLSAMNGMMSVRRIEFVEVIVENDRRILVVNLTDEEEGSTQGAWSDSFQGSAQAADTGAFLVDSLLQRHYDGDWYEALRVLYRGNEFPAFDHIYLTPIFSREPSS